jgi:hypothetical protein
MRQYSIKCRLTIKKGGERRQKKKNWWIKKGRQVNGLELKIKLKDYNEQVKLKSLNVRACDQNLGHSY